jgi:SH3-like domain-containing protein
MWSRLKTLFYVVLASGLATVSVALGAGVKNGPSGLPIPRFVSIVQTEANMRVGPGEEFPVKWQYRRPGLPLEVIGEHGDWRKVRDHEGQEGFMLKRLLGGGRFALITAQDGAARLRRRPAPDAYIKAFLVNNQVVAIEQCSPRFCKVSTAGHIGWVARDDIWGVYSDEIID